MNNKKDKKKKVIKTKVNTNTKKIKAGKKLKFKKTNIITIIDYTFLISLALSIMFGMQTNGAFFVPFTIALAATIICMCIIFINAISSLIKKKFGKKKSE